MIWQFHTFEATLFRPNKVVCVIFECNLGTGRYSNLVHVRFGTLGINSQFSTELF